MSEFANTARKGEIRAEVTVTLTSQLKRYSVDLDSADLSLIIGKLTNKLDEDKSIKKETIWRTECLVK